MNVVFVVKSGELMMDIKTECDIFQYPTGRTAETNCLFGGKYNVVGSYLDPSGCMKTYGKDSNGNDKESFIVDTNYY